MSVTDKTRIGLGAIAVLASLGWAEPLRATSPNRATSSRAAREEAIRSIPFDKLTDQTRAKLWAVVSKPSVYRRMPVRLIQCDPDLHIFLVRYPEVVANIWRLMGITKVSARRTGDYSFHGSDGMGTVADIDLVYGTADTHIFYADATYDGPLTSRTVKARCVLILKAGYVLAGDGRVYVINRLDTFVRLDDRGAALLVKTLYPLVGRMVDRNFTEAVSFLQRISQTAETNAPGMQRLAARLTLTEPEVRKKFAELTLAVARRSADRDKAGQAAPTAAPLSPEWKERSVELRR